MIKLQSLLRESIAESHQQGEWWIDRKGMPQSLDAVRKDQVGDVMKFVKWKRMKASGDKIEVETWEMTPQDLTAIIRGIKAIMNKDPQSEDPNDPDKVVSGDSYAGPRIDLTIVSKDKQFKNVPLSILEKCLPSRMKNYEKGKEPDLAGPMNEDKSYHHLHKDYRLFEGNDHIVAIFEDNSRLVFEVHYHDKHGEDRDKWRRQAFSKWKSVANELHRDVQLTEVGNPVEKTWKECFQEALKHPKLKDYIRKPHHQKVFDEDGAPK
jgi:hypothetical protein